MRDPDDVGIFVKEGQRFRWQGEASMAFPAYGGVLHFDAGRTRLRRRLAARASR